MTQKLIIGVCYVEPERCMPYSCLNHVNGKVDLLDSEDYFPLYNEVIIFLQ